MTAISNQRQTGGGVLLLRRPFLLTLAAVFALDAMTGLVIIGYGNSYLIDVLKAPPSYPAYAIGLYGLVKLLAAPPGGWLLERLRTSSVVAIAGTATIAGLLTILAHKSAGTYFLGVGLVSFGSAFAWLNVFHVLGYRHEASERGAATASMGAVSAGATAIGLGIAALVAETPHWRVAFFIGVAFSVLAMLLLFPVQAEPAPFDVKTKGEEAPVPIPEPARGPVGRRRFAATFVVFAHFATISALLAGMVPLMLRTLDLSLLQAGFALTPAGAGAAVGMLVIGWRSKAGRRLRTAALLYFVVGASVAVLAGATGPVMFAIASFPLGLSLGAVQPIVNASLIDAARAEQRSGVALGYLFFVEGAGSIAGPLGVGLVISLADVRPGVAAIAAMAVALASVAWWTSRDLDL